MQDYAEHVANLVKRHAALTMQRVGHDSLWREISDLIMPRNQNIGISGGPMPYTPNTGREARIFDSTAGQSIMTLAAGHMAWLTPVESPWWTWDVNDAKGNSPGMKRWLAECTELMREYLALSNFYGVLHECWLDRSAFGTTAIYCELDDSGGFSPLTFEQFGIGAFCLADNHRGQADTLFREIVMSARQMREKWGDEKLSPKVIAALTATDARQDTKFRVCHAIYPRTKRDTSMMDGENMPIASCYFLPDEKHLIEESGYEELPFAASRFLRWANGADRSPYGWSPSWAALPDARQLNFLQAMLDAMAEKAAFPPMLIHEGHEGKVDARARGVTYFNTADTAPRTWQTEGTYQLGMERVQARQQSVRDAFHERSLQMLRNIDREMTALEVAERGRENLTNISPTFSLAITELVQPIMRRAFNLLLRNGHLPPPPQDAIQPIPGNPSQGFLPDPRIQFSNRFALAQKQLHNAGFLRTLATAMQAAQFAPDVLDNFDLDAALPDMALNDGVPPDYIRTPEKRDAMRQARAQAQQQAQQMEQASQMADAASKIGRIPADSAIAQQLTQS
jgi:hypothetical protein